MMCHGDRAHYILEGIGIHGGENKWLSDDSGIPLKDHDRAPSRQAERQGLGDLRSHGACVGGISK